MSKKNTKKTIKALEEELNAIAVALLEAKKLKEADNADEVDDIKKDKKSDKDDKEEDDKDDKDDDEVKENFGDTDGGKEPDVKDKEGDPKDAATWSKAKIANGLKKEERAKKLQTLMQSYREEDQPPVETVGSPFDLKAKIKESVAVIFDGETLSEDFKKKATTVFEAALTSRITEQTKLIEAAAQKALEEAVSEIEEDLVEKTDEYVGFIVSEWLEENKIQVEEGIKTEIYEGFFEGPKNLYTEHNINISQETIDIVEDKDVEIAELTESANALTEKLIKADKIILDLKKQDILKALSEGLVATQVEKLKSLVSDIEAKDEAVFKEKVTIIKESYFKPEVAVKKDDVTTTKVITEEIDKGVQRYLDHAKASNN